VQVKSSTTGDTHLHPSDHELTSDPLECSQDFLDALRRVRRDHQLESKANRVLDAQKRLETVAQHVGRSVVRMSNSVASARLASMVRNFTP